VNILTNEDELFKFKIELLKKEIDILSSTIGRYDDILFKIKGWTITLWIAVVGWGILSNSMLLLILALFVPILFCFLEVQFKMIQRQYIFRGNYLQKFFHNDEKLKEVFKEKNIPQNPGIYDLNAHYIGKIKELSEKYKKMTNFFWIIRFPNVYLFYLTILILTIIAIIIVYFGCIQMQNKEIIATLAYLK